MAKDNIGEYSSTAASNTVVGDVNIAEGTAPSNINNAIREVMSHLADAHGAIAAYQGVTNSITAGTTQTQAGATALTEPINRVTVIGTNGDGVKLPTATAGLSILVLNDDSAQTLKVWPNTSDAIDGGSANAVDANQIAAGASRLYVAIDATNWYTALNDLGTIPLGVASGGTGAATLTDGGILLGSGTGAITATAVLADGEILVGDGTTDPVAESGATARTSLGLGTGDSPTFTAVTAGQVDVTAQGDVRFQDSSGGQYAAFQAPGTISSSHTYTWPDALPGGDRYLQSTDAGVLTWESISAGAITALNNATANELVTVGSTTTELDAESGLTFSGTVLNITDSTDGRLFVPDGTGALPSIAIGASRNSGMYTTGDGNIALTASGGLGGSGHEMRFLGNGTLHIDESANTFMTTGITINQAGAYNEIFALKSSSIDHGVTGIMETDTYFKLGLYDSDNGGARIEAAADSFAALWTRCTGNGESVTDTTSSDACIKWTVGKRDGTGKTPLGSTANMVAWSNDGTTRVLYKGDGTVHASDTSWATSLDSEDDMFALRMLDKAQSTKGIVDSAWDSMIGTDWEYLQKIGVAGSNHPEKGHPDMFSMQGVIKLNMGATWYLGQNFMALLETMERRMPGIRDEFETHMLEQSGRPAMLTQEIH